MPRMGDSNHYNRQQRVPKGYTGGGRWTDGDDQGDPVAQPDSPDSTATSQFLDPQSGAVVNSQVIARDSERHTITMPDGTVLTYEQSGDIHRIYENGKLVDAYRWTDSGPVREPVAEPAFFDEQRAGRNKRLLAAQALLSAFLARIGWRQGGTIIAMGYTLQPDASPVPRSMTEEEVRRACKKYDDVRSIFDRAELAVRGHSTSYDPSTYGTKVHAEAAHEINGSIIDPATGKKRFRMSYEAQDPNFVAEASIFKAIAGNPALTITEALKQKNSRFAMGGTVRLDVLENVDGKNDLVCVYDFKTGEEGLDPRRFREIRDAVWLNFPMAKRLVIIEMRSKPK